MAPNPWQEGVSNFTLTHIAEAFGHDTKTVGDYRGSQAAVDGCSRVNEWKSSNGGALPSLSILKGGIERFRGKPQYQKFIEYANILEKIVGESRGFWKLDKGDEINIECMLDAHRIFGCFTRVRSGSEAGVMRTPRTPRVSRTSATPIAHLKTPVGTSGRRGSPRSTAAPVSPLGQQLSPGMSPSTPKGCLGRASTPATPSPRSRRTNTTSTSINTISTYKSESASPGPPCQKQKLELPPITLQVLWDNAPDSRAKNKLCRDAQRIVPGWDGFLGWLNNQYQLDSLGLKVLECKAFTKVAEDHHLRPFDLIDYEIDSYDAWANALTIASRQLWLMVMFTSAAATPQCRGSTNDTPPEPRDLPIAQTTAGSPEHEILSLPEEPKVLPELGGHARQEP